MTTLIWLASTISIAVSLVFVMRFQTKLRMVKLNSPWERIVWSFRVNRLGYPFPKTIEEWDNGDFDPYRIKLLLDSWEFLRPFFSSRGYTLYQKAPRSAVLVPPPIPGPATDDLQLYPYARRISAENAPEMSLVSERVWAARDKFGRDVVIKLVSELNNPSDEWRILQRLNEKNLRSDPRNHTIFVLDYVIFDKFVFVVMPRWDTSMDPDFATVSELMEFSKAWLEVLDFLHEHRIAHQDFIIQNTGINVFGSYRQVRFRKGLRNPGEVRYALYDFGHSLLYPENVDINNVQTTRFIRFHHEGIPGDSYNPFKADVAMLGGTLEERVRHIENIVPEIGPFFEQMKDENEKTRLSARQALRRFLEIYNSLTPARLATEVTTIRWEKGKYIPKEMDG